ncbi:MAG: NRDE family protein [Bacteroidetes bacterium]|nr:NRDE family protein [Bacteroidota bacterium]
MRRACRSSSNSKRKNFEVRQFGSGQFAESAKLTAPDCKLPTVELPPKMCTVTYIPQPGGHFVLTSNRDENAARSPQHLDRERVGGASLIFPRDTAAGGTWIAASDTNRVACLLNGAFVKHKHQPPYKRSRGLMVLDFFRFATAVDFFENYDFDGMEPFTLIVVDDGQPYELRWDEKQPHVCPLDPQGRYLWSSATLYPGDAGKMRQEWFQNWLAGRQDFSLEAIQHFHETGGQGDPWNGFIMNRQGRVQTVSITNVVKSPEGISLIYNDLLRGMVKLLQIPTKTASHPFPKH